MEMGRSSWQRVMEPRALSDIAHARAFEVLNVCRKSKDKDLVVTGIRIPPDWFEQRLKSFYGILLLLACEMKMCLAYVTLQYWTRTKSLTLLSILLTFNKCNDKLGSMNITSLIAHPCNVHLCI